MKRAVFILIISFLAASCAVKLPVYDDPIPVHDSLTISSKILQENRTINIWTPPLYTQSMDSLPVLYMPDGGIQEDFPHIANTLSKLIEAKQIPPFILVGIENTIRARDLTGASEIEAHKKYNIPMDDGANNFRNFILDELMPAINNRYRTTQEKGIIGESLAGLFVIETLLLSPASFDFYIAMDPSLWWNEGKLVEQAEQLLNNLPERTTKLWFAGSSAKDIYKYTN